LRRSIAVMGWTLWDGRGTAPTGGSVVTYELTRRLSRHFDCEMVFETSDEEKVGRTVETDGGFAKRYVPRARGPWRLGEDFLRRYDLIHIWSWPPVYTYRAFTKAFVPHCHTLHSAASMMDWARPASAFFNPGHDAVALASRCLAEALNRFWEVPVDVIPFAADHEFFRPMGKEECREALHVPADRLVLGYLGRVPKLDLALAHDTVRGVAEATGRRDLLLLVAGGSRKVDPLYVRDDLLYLGRLDNPDVPVMLNCCDVFLNPVAGAQEGFGLTVVEAMACGLPVVTTSWDGYRDTVAEGTGFLARTCWRGGDVWINRDDLVRACARLAEDEGLRAEMGRRARRRVEESYTWERCVQAFRRLFLEQIQKGPPERTPYGEAPGKIATVIDGKTRFYSLEEAMKRPAELRLDFHGLYEGFVSEGRMEGGGWRRFLCRDNILNLPKYQRSMKEALQREERRLDARFPRLVRALRE